MGPASTLALVRNSVRVPGARLRWRWMRVPGLCAREIATSRGFRDDCVPFVTGGDCFDLVVMIAGISGMYEGLGKKLHS